LGEYDLEWEAKEEEKAVPAHGPAESGVSVGDEDWNGEARRASKEGVVGAGTVLRGMCAVEHEMGWWKELRQGLVLS
jgi:hypothetical protein